MPEQVGKIIRMQNKCPGPSTLAVNTVGEGLRKHIHLCFACRNFCPGHSGHCPISAQLYDLCTKSYVAVAMVRCAAFEPKPHIEVHDSRQEHHDPNA